MTFTSLYKMHNYIPQIAMSFGNLSGPAVLVCDWKLCGGVRQISNQLLSNSGVGLTFILIKTVNKQSWQSIHQNVDAHDYLIFVKAVVMIILSNGVNLVEEEILNKYWLYSEFNRVMTKQVNTEHSFKTTLNYVKTSNEIHNFSWL